MSQADIIKSRIIDVEWSVAPSPVQPVGRRSRPDHPVAQPSTPAPVTALALAAPVFVSEQVELSGSLDPRLVMLSAPGSVQARSYRLLQNRLLAQANVRVVAVTSASPGEGKTTCAANLALALAEAAMARVLLIDANLPRPGLAELFRFEPADGLMTQVVWCEESTPPYAVASIAGSQLQLAALKPNSAQGRRLDRPVFGATIRSLRSVYDYIVIDTASVLESADANIVSECSDGVILSARSGKSRKGELRRALDQLQPATVIGAALLDT